MRKVNVALVSVYNKEGIVEFCRRLSGLDIRIISTGGTATKLNSSKIQVTLVEEITGYSKLLDGRVKTLHPKLHSGILARRALPSHLQQLEELGTDPIDMVVVDFYPFGKAREKHLPLAEAMELVDIGGPTMARAAAKNFEDVLVVPGPGFYGRIADELEKGAGHVSFETRAEMAVELFRIVSQYDAAVASYLSELTSPKVEGFPQSVCLGLRKLSDLRYGENPHQKAALYATSDNEAAVLGARLLSGKELSYNNIVDLSAALNLVVEFEQPAVAIVKHRSPCGVAIGKHLAEAYERALAADPVSAYGCIIACNKPVDPATAKLIHGTTFVEAVIAPEYAEGVLDLLSKKKNRRFLEYPECFPSESAVMLLTSVPGGVLVQNADKEVFDEANMKTVTEVAPDDLLLSDMRFAWLVCKHVKSNAIVLARHGVTVGIGAGQTNRVDAARIAVTNAGERSKGAVLASDAFFPFADSIEEAHKAGIAAIIQPGGSKRDDEVIEACNRLRIPMVFTGMRHFLH